MLIMQIFFPNYFFTYIILIRNFIFQILVNGFQIWDFMWITRDIAYNVHSKLVGLR